METRPITNYDNVIDSRDVIARIAELSEWEGEDVSNMNELDDDERTELAALRRLAEEGEGLADWRYGETLIRDSYFTEWAQEYAEDNGAIPEANIWPGSYIDWEAAADALKMDYTSVDFDGVTYWGRS